MNIDQLLHAEVQKAVAALFDQSSVALQLQATNPEFEGSHTLVCFPLTKITRKGPEETARLVGDYLVQNSGLVNRYNVVKGFLNLVLNDSVWGTVLKDIYENADYGQLPTNGQEIMIEYSSPNTNKPLHLGHLRNNFLGWSVSEIYKANGYTVHKVQIINDRGIHICKSMAAWQLYGDGETPRSSGMKGDHLVGKYYVEFDKAYKAQIKALVEKGSTQEDAEKQAPIMQLASELLRKWEQNDADTLELWKTMNGWVYEGFAISYKNLGVDFDKMYYESNTYLLGKELVQEGLEKGVFYKKDNGSVAIDLSKEGLDEKIVLRSDGTSVYITQDLGTAIERFKEFPDLTQLIYTVGNEQDYHFKVLFKILEKLGYDWAKECYHLSYGMVELPEGKMKSREGTVVDADDLVDEMVNAAREVMEGSDKLKEFSEEERAELYPMVGMGALKYFILKVDPKKKMLFDPKESISLIGNTGPFIQYTYVRTRSILREMVDKDLVLKKDIALQPKELEIIRELYEFPATVTEAAKAYNPGAVANYLYELAKLYNQFWQEVSVLKEPDTDIRLFRLMLCQALGNTLRTGMGLLGMQAPERM